MQLSHGLIVAAIAAVFQAPGVLSERPFLFAAYEVSINDIGEKTLAGELRKTRQRCSSCSRRVLIWSNTTWTTPVLERPLRGGIEAYSPRIYREAAAHETDFFAAEAIEVASGKVVRMRRGKELVRKIVRGKDPLKIEIGGVLKASVQYIVHDDEQPMFFVKSNASDSLQAEMISQNINRTFAAGAIRVVVRKDGWFHAWGSYPLINLFEEIPSDPPAFADHSGEFVCDISGGKTQCHGR